MSALVADKGELFIDIVKNTLVLHDGTTPGGWPMAHEVHVHSRVTPNPGGSDGFMSADDKQKLDVLSATGGIQSILSNGSPMSPRNTVDFNTDFTLTDDSGALKTNFAISTAFREEINSNMVALLVALG
jgi:hypothetical protein